MVIFAIQDDFEIGPTYTGGEKDVVKLSFSSSDNVDKIVNSIVDAYMSNPGMVDCLFLCAHGNSGMVSLGNGIGVNRAAKFALLKGIFSANSRGIEIHGCGCASPTELEGNHLWISKDGTVGRSGKGFDFVKSMAVNSGVKTTASFQSISGFRAAYKYIGVDTLTVNPNGSSYTTWRDGAQSDDHGTTSSY